MPPLLNTLISKVHKVRVGGRLLRIVLGLLALAVAFTSYLLSSQAGPTAVEVSVLLVLLAAWLMFPRALKMVFVYVKTHWILVIAILVIATGLYFLYGSYAQKPTYAEYLSKHLAIGDTTSVQCGELESKLALSLLGTGMQVSDYFYSYSKHRCLAREIAVPANGVLPYGEIVDVATGETIISCYQGVTDLDPTVICKDDAGHAWGVPLKQGYDTSSILSPLSGYDGITGDRLRATFQELQQLEGADQ